MQRSPSLAPAAGVFEHADECRRPGGRNLFVRVVAPSFGRRDFATLAVQVVAPGAGAGCCRESPREYGRARRRTREYRAKSSIHGPSGPRALRKERAARPTCYRQGFHNAMIAVTGTMVSPLTVDMRAVKAPARPQSTRLKDVAAAREEGEKSAAGWADREASPL